MEKCSQNRIIVLFYSKILDIYHKKNLQTLALWACGFKDLYKNEILEKIIEVMLKRITREEGNATDYSRLGWLLLNINNRDKAEEIAESGLKIDNNNDYCHKLLLKIRN